MSKKGGIRARKEDGSLEHLFKGKWNKGKTRTIRVPEAIADEVMAVARAIDNGEEIHLKKTPPSKTNSS